MFDFTRADLMLMEDDDVIAVYLPDGTPAYAQLFKTAYKSLSSEEQEVAHGVIDTMENVDRIYKWGRLVECDDLTEEYLWVRFRRNTFRPIETSSIHKTGGNTYYKFI